MSIRINATVAEARDAAGHTVEQWNRFYVRCGPACAPSAWLTKQVHNERRGQAAVRGTQRVVKMDPYPRERKGGNAGANKYPVGGGTYTACRDDYPEVAGLAASERHPAQIR
jgi:hypothetical protein